MADASKVSVAVERAAHDALGDLANSLYELHGIQINSVSFSWIAGANADGEIRIVSAVTVDTTSVCAHRPAQ